jgi:Zn-dependent peptidase ImmA (M78 family)
MDDRLALFARSVPDYGHRSLTLADGLDQCEARGYRVLEIPMRDLFGVTRRVQGSIIYITLNALLDPAEKTVTLWHEIGHCVLHDFKSAVLRSFGLHQDRRELEAEAIALAAYIPRVAAEHLTVPEIAERYRIRLALADLRKLAIKHFDI